MILRVEHVPTVLEEMDAEEFEELEDLELLQL
jgi:hypothetical protein